ncbi:MAG TPA: 8-amino-7-oxononanoate synthase [Abditibacteriaceae bacterium]|jgi:8-amino-7-oxononanoate synthase
MFDDELRQELEHKRNTGLLRQLRAIPDGVLDCASNDYLGLARHPEVVEAAAQAARAFGAGARASRLVSGETALHHELENSLAAWRETESALVFSSGWAANVAAISSLARGGDAIFCDKRNHASLIDGCRFALANGATVRFYNSQKKLCALLETANAPRKIIVSDAVYSMDGDVADVPELLRLAREFNAVLVLDDAHGTGTLGKTGRGALEFWRESTVGFDRTLRDVALVQTGTLSKALGAQGGFVAASRAVCDWLVNAGRPFVYSTGLAPSACGAALQSLYILQREPQRIMRLRDVTKQLASGLQNLGYNACLHPSPVIPVIVGEAEEALRLSDALMVYGIWCPAIRPPTVPRSTARLRVTACAAFPDSEIARILEAFNAMRANSTVL